MRSLFAASTAAVLAIGLSLPSVLQARDTPSQRDGGSSMMGSGMKGMGQMGQMMDHCNQMMQGTSGRPNERWRDDRPAQGNRTDKNQ